MIDDIRLGERGNGYNQAYNDILAILLEYRENHVITARQALDLLREIEIQKNIREATGWAHPEDVTKTN